MFTLSTNDIRLTLLAIESICIDKLPTVTSKMFDVPKKRHLLLVVTAKLVKKVLVRLTSD